MVNVRDLPVELGDAEHVERAYRGEGEGGASGKADQAEKRAYGRQAERRARESGRNRERSEGGEARRGGNSKLHGEGCPARGVPEVTGKKERRRHADPKDREILGPTCRDDEAREPPRWVHG